MKKVVVVVATYSGDTTVEGVEDLVGRIFSSVPAKYDASIVLAVNNSPPEFSRGMGEIAARDNRVHDLQLGWTRPQTFAIAYLRGFERALALGTDYIVEMDANGSHDPAAISEFLAELENGADAVFSTRFSHGGRVVGYPFQRVVISMVGTVLSNALLTLNRVVPDMTSGFEAFRRETLQGLFKLAPSDEWISVTKGPGYFYQTEMRAYLCWMGGKISIVPIIWGANRVTQNNAKIAASNLTESLRSLWALKKRRREFLAHISQT